LAYGWWARAVNMPVGYASRDHFINKLKRTADNYERLAPEWKANREKMRKAEEEEQLRQARARAQQHFEQMYVKLMQQQQYLAQQQQYLAQCKAELERGWERSPERTQTEAALRKRARESDLPLTPPAKIPDLS
jgi:hypothetical protein